MWFICEELTQPILCFSVSSSIFTRMFNNPQKMSGNFTQTLNYTELNTQVSFAFPLGRHRDSILQLCQKGAVTMHHTSRGLGNTTWRAQELSAQLGLLVIFSFMFRMPIYTIYGNDDVEQM